MTMSQSSLFRAAEQLARRNILHPESTFRMHRSLHTRLSEVEAESVVIGGGIIGTSIAYHLARQGQKNVVLLEKSELTSGSTWHAAGLTTLFHPTVSLKRIHMYSINMYSNIGAETGQEVGFHRPGSIRLATTPTRVDEMRHTMSRNDWMPNPQSLIDPETIKEMVPFINTRDVLMGLYNPYDGHIDPFSLTQAIAKGAKMRGAVMHQQTPVTGLRLKEDGNWIVATARGDIVARRVVNAAGFCANDVAKMAGSELPIAPGHHQYLISSSIPEVEAMDHEMPVLRHLEGSFYARQERSSILVGVYESQEKMVLCEGWIKDRVDPDFGKELFDSDIDRIMPHLEVAMDLLPPFGTASIQSVVCGPITYCPDGLPMLGPHLLPNMWIAAGFGYGIIHGGGAGKYLADWIVKGEPEFDLIELDPLRFSKWTSKEFILKKTRETYGFNNAVGFPYEERFAGRPTTRVSSAYEKQVERGANMDFHSGWEQPSWFASEGEKPAYKPSFLRPHWNTALCREYDTVMTRVGVIDLTPFGKFHVEGPQAAKFLEYITANSLPKVGRTVITHMLTPKAKVYSEVTLSQVSPGVFFMVTGSGSELHDLRRLHEEIRRGNWDVRVLNVTDEMGCLSVAGPNSKDLLASLNPDFSAKFPFLSLKELVIDGIKVLAIRISYTGELGWELYHPIKDTGRLYEEILKQGKPLGVGDFGSHTMNCMRLEKGFRMWGAEMNLDDNIVNAGLMPFVKMEKKNFVGKSALEEILKERPTTSLVQVKIWSSDYDPTGNETVWLEGKVVGNTTSGCFSPHLSQPLAFCHLHAMLAVPGTKVKVDLVGQLCEAEVLPGPPLLTYTVREASKKKN